MSIPLDPIVSEFETQEQADSYQRWFRERVEASLADPRPGIPHDEVMAEMESDAVDHHQAHVWMLLQECRECSHKSHLLGG